MSNLNKTIYEVFNILLDIHRLVLNNITEENAKDIVELCKTFKTNLNNIILNTQIKTSEVRSEQPWKLLIGLTDDEIRKMLDEKYTTARDIAEAFRGFLPSKVVSDVRSGKIKRKQTVINHILKEFRKIDAFKR